MSEMAPRELAYAEEGCMTTDVPNFEYETPNNGGLRLEKHMAVNAQVSGSGSGSGVRLTNEVQIISSLIIVVLQPDIEDAGRDAKCAHPVPTV
ncbi:jg23028 [Pararge aegeria aegeria]|uniref:Jg23028 protein n=1 Tax=Pararge aegeria aegeria TaxID=348720 RepID=A0A8S4SN43_9NEOP|nr:jg23028 [Pararge aegeria aegeria]